LEWGIAAAACCACGQHALHEINQAHAWGQAVPPDECGSARLHAHHAAVAQTDLGWEVKDVQAYAAAADVGVVERGHKRHLGRLEGVPLRGLGWSVRRVCVLCSAATGADKAPIAVSSHQAPPQHAHTTTHLSGTSTASLKTPASYTVPAGPCSCADKRVVLFPSGHAHTPSGGFLRSILSSLAMRVCNAAIAAGMYGRMLLGCMVEDGREASLFVLNPSDLGRGKSSSTIFSRKT